MPANNRTTDGRYRLFCSICKTHIEIAGESLKDAIGRFNRLGHDDRKVKRLRRGPVGWYRTPADLAAEHEERELAKAAKALEAVTEAA